MPDDFRPFRPPGYPDTIFATPQSETAGRLLGCASEHNGVKWTRDEARAIWRLYGFNITRDPLYPERAPDPGPKPSLRFDDPDRSAKMAAWEAAVREHVRALHGLQMAGATRNAARYAERDGLRAIALLARFCEPGQDPVRVLAEVLQEAGLDLQTGWEDDPEDVGTESA